MSNLRTLFTGPLPQLHSFCQISELLLSVRSCAFALYISFRLSQKKKHLAKYTGGNSSMPMHVAHRLRRRPFFFSVESLESTLVSFQAAPATRKRSSACVPKLPGGCRRYPRRSPGRTISGPAGPGSYRARAQRVPQSPVCPGVSHVPRAASPSHDRHYFSRLKCGA